MEVSNNGNNSNIRSINLSERIVNGFDEGYDTDQEIKPFYDAIPDIDECSVEDDLVYY